MTPKQTRAITGLLTQPTKNEAAAAAGISPATLRRYLADEEFQREYKKALAELMQDAAARARQSISPALECLRDICMSEDETSTARIQAARALMEYSLQIISVTDIEARIEELERARDDAADYYD